MKFAEHLLAHITPEWRRQYIVYEDMKTMLYEAVENLPSIDAADAHEIEQLVRAFDENFLAFCEKELFKINVFYEEKLAEAKRKFDTLRKEMDALALESQRGDANRGAFRLAGGSNASASSKLINPLTRLISNGGAAGDSSGSLFHIQQPQIRSTRLPSIGSNAGSLLTNRRHSLASNTLRGLTKQPNVTTALTDGQRQRHSQAATTISAGAKENKAPTTGVANQTSPVAASSYPNYGTLFSTTRGVDRKKLNDLKLAFSEFYLSLVLLQNYQRLNFTGFRKIFKKHDKLLANNEGKRWHSAHVETAFFHTNKDVDKLIEDTENIVTYQLESGDRQKAMKRLRVPPLNDAPQPWTTFRVGFWLGALIVLLAAVVLTGLFQQTGDDWRIVFRLYRSSLFIILFVFLVGVNIYGWRAHGVNHVLIFELDPRDHLSGQDLLEISFSFGVLWCLSVLLFLWSKPMGIPPLLNPMILNGIMLIYLFNPTKTLHYSARIWLICCIVSIAILVSVREPRIPTPN